MKRIMLMLLPVSLIAFLSGCSLFVKEVDYQPIANDLNKKNMDEILNAVDGYAEINQRAFVITTMPEKQDEIKKETDKILFWGVYDTSSDTALGAGEISFESIVVKSNIEEQISEEVSSESTVNYSDNQYVNLETNGELDLTFMLDKLQGIEEIVPADYSYGLDEPPSIFYDFNEQEFNKIINDDLQIEYDNFKKATLLISLQESKRDKKFYITKIGIGVEWEERDGNGEITSFELYNNVDMNIDNQKAKEDYRQLDSRS